MIEPTPDQLRDFFRSDILQVEKVFEENYDLAVEEFYRRFSKWNSPLDPPIDGIEVLVAYREINGSGGQLTYGTGYFSNGWAVNADIYEEVVYWQYLPELPKQE